jgi:CRP-like cAMP-binding protein
MASDPSGQGRQNSLLAAISPEDHALLTPYFKEMALKMGTVLQEPETPIEFVYFPLEGMVSLFAVMSDGRGIEIATGKEGVVGAMCGCL